MSAAKSPEPNPLGGTKSIIIIRYPNRRLYDRAHGQYVTLKNVADMIRQGHAVTVQDSKSGEDLTRVLLTQILLDQYPERMEMIPIPILHMMIGANEVVLGLLRGYWEQSLNFVEMMNREQVIQPLVTPFDWMKTLMPSFPLPATMAGSSHESGELAQRVNNIEKKLEELHKTIEPKPGRQSSKKSAPRPRKRSSKEK